MKIRLVLKDPDGIHDCLAEDAKTEAERIAALTDGALKAEDIIEKIKENHRKAIGHFIDGDYINIELCTETKTARVLTRTEANA